SIELGPLGSIRVSGIFQIGPGGLVLQLGVCIGTGSSCAAYDPNCASSSSDCNANFGNGSGIGFSARGSIQINTTGAQKTFTTPAGTFTVDAGFLLHLDGDIEFTSFAKASGSFTIKITSGAFELSFDATLHLGPLDLAV